MNTNNPEDSEEQQRIADFFESNKTPAAQVRDVELEIAAKGPPPVDLRDIPKEQWDLYANYELTLPPDIVHYLAGREPGSIDAEEEKSLVRAVTTWHDVKEPWYVVMDDSMREHGRSWSYAPEAEAMLTGFMLVKNE